MSKKIDVSELNIDEVELNDLLQKHWYNHSVVDVIVLDRKQWGKAIPKKYVRASIAQASSREVSEVADITLAQARKVLTNFNVEKFIKKEVELDRLPDQYESDFGVVRLVWLNH